MEITTHSGGNGLEVRPKGRLDGYWADHLSKTLDEAMRQGHDRIEINMSEVTYLSSLGIRVLVTYYKKVQAIQGVFQLREPVDVVKRVLDMAGLSGHLMGAATAPAVAAATAPTMRSLDRPNALFEVYDLAPANLSCQAVGDPKRLLNAGYTASDCRAISFPRSSFGLGLGATGQGFEDCRGRFGEFLAVGGAAAYQPTDGSNVPDFLLAEGSFVPEMQVLYGAMCEGSFGALARFERKPEATAVGMAEIADTVLEIAGSATAGFVCVAESAGMVGASLRRPPVEGNGADVFKHPEVRSWLSFTTERAYARALSLVVGLVSRDAPAALAPMLRPVGGGTSLLGHFHAVAFTYRPLQRGLLDLDKTVRSLFENEQLLGLLHLIGDDRELNGVAESEFVRGACWVGPIDGGAK